MKEMIEYRPEFEVFIEDGIKKFRSKNYNYSFSLKDGYFERWGATEKDDPTYSPYGPEILDLEITDKCNGIDGKLCAYCYKSNTPNGQNMSFDNFKKVIEKINYNQQLTQVAFGLGSTADENPDLWDMCDYLRKNHIIPNGTVAQLSDSTACKIATNFGAVACSFHNNFEVLADTIDKLSIAKRTLTNVTLKQINIHFMLAEETYDDCMKLIDIIKKDERFKELNAVVLLGLKKCGRAKTGFNVLDIGKFQFLVEHGFQANNIGYGFDSCSAARFEEVVRFIARQNIDELLETYDKHNDENKILFTAIAEEEIKLRKILQLVEPCESGLFSSYVNLHGIYFHCSFYEQQAVPDEGLKLLANNSFEDYWNGKIGHIKEWRQCLHEANRKCPVYDVGDR